MSLMVLGFVMAAAGLISGDDERIRASMTYGNFDSPPAHGQSAVGYLSPGIADLARDKAYRFDGGVEWPPLAALAIVFAVILFWRVWRNPEVRKGGGARWLVQWLGFVGTRIGVLRVGQVLPVPRCALGVLPVLNCQACEMANGACPIAALQVGFLHLDIPLLAVGTVVAAGALAGRWFCGWLCPFGLLEDLLGRFSTARLKAAAGWRWAPFVVLGLVAVLALAMGLAGLVESFPFCSTACPSGVVLGLAPYFLSTGKPGVQAALSQPWPAVGGMFFWLSVHAVALLVYLALKLNVSGRLFCRYLCPLGAALGLFNRWSLVRISGSGELCRACGRCLSTCPMGGTFRGEEFLSECGCIRCGACVRNCDRGNRAWVFGAGNEEGQVHGAA
jgi:ferredoxin